MHTQNDFSFSTVVPSSSYSPPTDFRLRPVLTLLPLSRSFSPRVRLSRSRSRSRAHTHSRTGSQTDRTSSSEFRSASSSLCTPRDGCYITDRNVGKGTGVTFTPRFHPEPVARNGTAEKLKKPKQKKKLKTARRGLNCNGGAGTTSDHYCCC